jgi:hypothetical protein
MFAAAEPALRMRQYAALTVHSPACLRTAINVQALERDYPAVPGRQ